MNLLVILLSTVGLVVGIGLAVYFFMKPKIERRTEFDATRDLFI